MLWAQCCSFFIKEKKNRRKKELASNLMCRDDCDDGRANDDKLKH